jgi:hypothetical protein
LLPSTTCLLLVFSSIDSLYTGMAYEGEALGVHGAGLNQELVSPAVEGVETLGVVDIVDEYAAVCTTVESNTERLESLLASSIPELAIASDLLR